jgi:hypothetical protein
VRLRVVALPFALAAAVTVLIWGGGTLYWHVRITGALRSWEQNPKAVHHLSAASEYGPPDAVTLLRQAGCRALPYLIRRLDESRDPQFLEGLTNWIITDLAWHSPEDLRLLGERCVTWYIDKDDALPDRRVKCERIREWWRENGSRYHQWWRFWSSWCLG